MGNLKSDLSYLKSKQNEYQSASDRKKKSSIEDQVRSYSINMDDEVYAMLNNGGASGLFGHGFFERDLENSIHKLEEKINSM